MSRTVDAKLRPITGQTGRGGPIREWATDRPAFYRILPVETGPTRPERFPRGPCRVPLRLERSPPKWAPVRRKRARHNKGLEPRTMATRLGTALIHGGLAR